LVAERELRVWRASRDNGQVKTAITVPDPLFARVEVMAQAFGMSRSEFYANAANHYLAYLEGDEWADSSADFDAPVDNDFSASDWSAGSKRSLGHGPSCAN